MKRLFFAISALAVMASCNNEELIEEAPKQAITFGNAFVDNATRAIDPSYTSENLDKFIVYGTVSGTERGEGTANIFSGVEVKKVTQESPAGAGAVLYNNEWWYSGSNVQYWIMGNKYNFTAIAGVESTAVSVDQGQKMPTKITYDATGQKDLLYVKNDEYTSTGSDGAVKFTFNHLLAKAQFTFENTMTTNTSTNYYQYKVSNVKFTNAYKAGTYTIASSTWNVSGERQDVPFGNITNGTNEIIAVGAGPTNAQIKATSHNQMLLVPCTYKNVPEDGTTQEVKGLIVSYTIQTLLNGTPINSEDITVEIVGEVNLQAGHAYNFIFSKGNPGDEIKFSLENVNGWDSDCTSTTKPHDITVTPAQP